MKKISIGSDHRGFGLKKYLMEQLSDVEWIDVGAPDDQRSDYPEFAQPACKMVIAHHTEGAVLICGSGIGMSMAANRFPGIYAGLSWTEAGAKQAKEDDGINVLVLPADYVDQETALRMVKAWLATTFKGGRYQERLDMLD